MQTTTRSRVAVMPLVHVKRHMLDIYAGWRQRTGEILPHDDRRGRAVALELAHAVPGFQEALALMHKGEKVMLWLPSADGTSEAIAYEVELVDVDGQAGRQRSAVGAANEQSLTSKPAEPQVSQDGVRFLSAC